MSKLAFLTTFLIISYSFSEEPYSSMAEMPPMNVIYHPVSTQNKEAQESFNRGLTYIFAFNHDIAFNEFNKAAKLDPELAMAYWGMALALGQNVNADITPENEIKCYELMQKATKLSSNAWPEEQAYIKAQSVRYSDDPTADLIQLRHKYRDAMKKVVTEYPEDLDAATLYAESILDLDPWRWWTSQGKPTEGIFEAIEVLESVLKRNPHHVGANHYNIHAFEESPFPEFALMSAYRLMTLLPEAGHLLHMPCHIFILVGDYESAVQTNKNAIAADKEYIKKMGIGGNYPIHYLAHNLYVMVRVYMLMEDYTNANKTALELQDFLRPHYEKMPPMAHFAIVPMEIYLYFNKWNEILDYRPQVNTPSVQAYHHYSRAVAYASLGDMKSAEEEKQLMLKAKDQITDSETIANNPAVKIIEIAEVMLDATLAHVQNKNDEYIDLLNKAISLQDQLDYDEPPAWYFPIRQRLGAALIKEKRYTEAEKAFRKTLVKLQRNGRSLFGLQIALKLQDQKVDAYWVEREMTAALQHASQPLNLDQL